MSVVDQAVMCASCGAPYWLTALEVEGAVVWELVGEDGEAVDSGYGEPTCPLCGGYLVPDPIGEIEA